MSNEADVILISGKAGSGKDTAATYLADKLGKTCILHFADMVKFIARQYMQWDGNKDEYGRTLLQTLGTEIVRIEHNKPVYWAERVADIIEFTRNMGYLRYVISDLRFPNEVYYMKSRFPYTYAVRINRVNFENKLTPEQRKHDSETALDIFKFDYYITNSMLDVFKSGLDKMCDHFNF